MHQLAIVFLTVFLAELGDKTQLATILIAADGQRHPVLIFLAASTALVAATAVAVVLGVAAERYFAVIPLKPIAGLGFLAIGAWTLWSHFWGGA